MKFAYLLSLASLAAAVPLPAVKVVYFTTYTTVYENAATAVAAAAPEATTAAATTPTAAAVETTPTTTLIPTTTALTTSSTAAAPATTAPTTTSAAATTSSPTTTLSPTSSASAGGASSGDKSGQGTYYDTGLGACGEVSKDTDFIVAISHGLFDPQTPNGNPNNNPLCGKKIRAFYEGKSVDVTVIDQCMGCAENDLDFSPAAFKQIADIDLGRIDITWEWL